MMGHHSRLKAAILAGTILLVLAPMEASVAAAAPVTGADFATLLSNFGSSGLSLTPVQAVDRMRQLGVPLGEPKAPLTEERLSEIMRYFGLTGTTARPGALVDASLANAAASILSVASPLLTSQDISRQPPQPADLASCQSERNRGQCKKCCMNQGATSKSCGILCQDLVPPSSSEPLP
jgi:hypothetical protein